MIYNYYSGWPYKGKYVDTLNRIYYILYNYLVNFPKSSKKYSVIFDIDDTLVFTDSLNIIKNNKYPNNWIKGYMLFPGISQIVNIAKLCKKLKFKIIILTARPYSTEKSSIKNLELLGIDYDEIYHNKNYPDIYFKVDFKKKLALSNNIILSIGDQWPDIKGIKNCLCIKLPTPEDTNAYYTFNNNNYYLI